LINEIIKGVSMKLNATFGAGYKIYQNDVEQGFKEPCFFIAVLKPDISPLQKNRFMNRNPLDIHYFPTSGRNNAELFTMAENFLTVLDKVSLFHRENLAFRPPIHSKGDGDNATVRKGGACLRHRNEVDICTGQNLVLHQEGAAAKGHIISPYLS
jgi:hypothetical protein